MLAKCYSGAVNGVDALTVEIEVYSSIGTSQFAIVGLPDAAVKEAKDRIPTALLRSTAMRSIFRMISPPAWTRCISRSRIR